MARASVIIAMIAGLIAGGLSPVTAVAAPAGPSERARTLELVRTGGELVAEAASAALVGTDEQVHEFLTEAYPVIAEHDDRIALTRLMAVSGTAVRNGANTAMNGSIEDVRAFLSEGWKAPWRNDQYQLVNRIIARSGPKVRQAGNTALNGTFEDVLAFINTGQHKAAEHDDWMRVNKIVATSAEGSAVYVAAQRALDGSIDDVREFLRSGWQVAVQRDQEMMTVAGLAELAAAEQQRAAEQTDAAKEASDQAVAAAEQAKRAAERAATEAAAAQGDATRAAHAASRAAAAARGAAAAAQTAINAAGRANDAARVAANAAGQAAIAASMTERAASRAHDAAAAAATDASKAHDARVAAQNARDVAKSATAAATASDAAGRAVTEAFNATNAAKSASGNADAAATAADEAAAAARAAGANAAEAERAAQRARQAAAEARRAAGASETLAQRAAQAAFDARDAANSAATHAIAAANAADEAADRLYDAEKAAERSAAAATESAKAADAAKSAADQAHLVARTARDADAERVRQAESQGVRDAQDAVLEEEKNRDNTRWRPGERETFDATTERLLTEARTAGADVDTVLAKTRQAAMRLLTRGGPWVQSAAEQALVGNEHGVRSFLATNLALAVEQDDRAGVGIIGRTTAIPKQRDAAIVAERGDYEAVKEFLRTRDYPGKREADRQEVNRVMAAAGQGTVVYAKGDEALDADLSGDVEALHRFLGSGRFEAALHDDRKAVNKVLETGGPEVKAAAQAALSGPDSHLAKFLLVELPKAQLRDADAAKHVAQIDGYLAKADQSAALARENANKAAEWAAIARKAVDEARQWRDAAAASAAAAAEAARQAEESAEAAQRSADQAAASAKQARDAAAQAQKSANAASASAANASASAAYANSAAAAARNSADAARTSADQAGKDAALAEAAANEAIDAAARFAQSADQQRNAGDVPKESEISPFGIESVPEDMRDDPRELRGESNCVGTRGGFVSCTYRVEHHITGTMRYFTFKCPAGATAKEQCERIEIGRTRVDFKVVKEHTLHTGQIVGQVLLELAKGLLNDFYRCATDKNLASQAEACAWSAAAVMPPSWIARLGRVGAVAKIYDPGDKFLHIGLLDESTLLASLSDEGRLSLAIALQEPTRGSGVGGTMVSLAFDHFAGRIKTVEGFWGTKMPSNLNAFNENLRNGMSVKDAARGTFTGHMAGKYGFSDVISIEVLPEGAHGAYTSVHVVFGPG
ncbi:ALF repeat-containing protein [Saccharothrix obliqua]|uniref:ALF repeat-containing protein n=1 Tax=Saccharothrix obliqua TaxID=2861747 RepID=UPI001C5EE36C|nr:ALF repeat-containing protein [Saccharothrix obliqua]MBW4721360.1 ALF repeat-containing protein [Saccharothrix obliqua]